MMLGNKKKPQLNRKKNGFTLIELLVVITIIALLSASITILLNSAKKSSRDAKRLTDARSYVASLEIYKDQKGKYPGYGVTGCDGTSNAAGTGIFNESTDCTGAVDDWNEIMSKKPVDPVNEGEYVYGYCSPDPTTPAPICAIGADRDPEKNKTKFKLFVKFEGKECETADASKTNLGTLASENYYCEFS